MAQQTGDNTSDNNRSQSNKNKTLFVDESDQGRPEIRLSDGPSEDRQQYFHTSEVTPEKNSRAGITLIIIVLFMTLLQEFLGSSCFYVAVFGIPCAGCGSSRAIALILQGEFSAALKMHPLIFLTLALIIIIPAFLALRYYLEKKRRKKWKPLPQRFMSLFFVSLSALYIIVYIYRMIRFFPHTEPMLYNPHSILGKIIAFFRSLITGA